MKSPQNPRILYAEVNEDSCQMMTYLFGFKGIQLTVAATVAEAWQLAQMNTFDLYLLDSRFPDGNGLELCRQLRKHAPHTPIIFYSAYAFETDRLAARAAGANSYIAKPYLDNLFSTVAETIKTYHKPATAVSQIF